MGFGFLTWTTHNVLVLMLHPGFSLLGYGRLLFSRCKYSDSGVHGQIIIKKGKNCIV